MILPSGGRKELLSSATSKLGISAQGEGMALARVPGELGHALNAGSDLAIRGKPSAGISAVTGVGPLRPAGWPGSGGPGGGVPSPTLSSTETSVLPETGSALITATSGKRVPWKLSTAKSQRPGVT